MASAKHDIFIAIREDLEKQVKADKFDVARFTESWLDKDLGGVAALDESAAGQAVTLSTIGQVITAARIFEVVPADTPSPWAAMKSKAPDYSTYLVKELRSLAKDKGVTGSAKMRKDDLVAALS